jgi:hypothetical protein
MTLAATATKLNKPAIGSIWRQAGIAAVVAAVSNGILFFVGSAFNGFPQDVLTPMGQPISLVLVVIMSIVPILLGAVGYTILSRITDRANLIFTIITAVIFVAMIYSPIPMLDLGGPMLMVILLEIMHAVVAGAAVYFLTRS